MALGPEAAPPLVAAIASFLVAAGVLALDFRGRGARALALLLAVTGLAGLTRALGPAFDDPATFAWLLRTHPYFALAAPFALAYLGAHAPRPLPRMTGAWASVPFLLAGAAAMALYASERTLFWAPHPVTGAASATGPLAALAALAMPLAALLALRLARAYVRAPEAERRSGPLYLAAGLAALPLHAAVATLLAGPPQDPAAAVRALALVPLALLAAELRVRGRRADLAAAHRSARVLKGMAAPALLAPLALLGPDAAFALEGLWALALPALAGAAVARHGLLGAELRLGQVRMKQSTIAAAFVAAFFVISESASALFSESVGDAMGIFTAGILVILLTEVQARVKAKRMGPRHKVEALTPDDRRGIYMEQAKVAWADGQLSPREREKLQRYREILKLSADEAEELERPFRRAGA